MSTEMNNSQIQLLDAMDTDKNAAFLKRKFIEELAEFGIKKSS